MPRPYDYSVTADDSMDIQGLLGLLTAIYVKIVVAIAYTNNFSDTCGRAIANALPNFT